MNKLVFIFLLCFCACARNADPLQKYGLNEGLVYSAGDTMIVSAYTMKRLSLKQGQQVDEILTLEIINTERELISKMLKEL